MTSKKLTTALLLSLLILPLGAPAGSTEECAEIDEVAILALDYVQIDKNSDVVGDVVVNTSSPGTSADLVLDKKVTVVGAVRADTVDIDPKANVMGEVECNSGDSECSGLTLPVVDPLPPFEMATIRPDAVDVSVGSNETLTLDPGEYGAVDVARRGTLILSGGLYEMRSLTVGGNPCGFPCTSLLFDGLVDLRVEGKVKLGAKVYLGPSSGSGLSAADATIYVAGDDDPDDPASDPGTDPAVQIAMKSTVEAGLYAPNGSLVAEMDLDYSGSIIARRVVIAMKADISADTAFSNQVPTADSQSVNTDGAASIEIVLTGSDPEGSDLTFAVPALGQPGYPTAGNLSNLTVNPPGSAQRCSLSATACTVDADCPSGQTCEMVQGGVMSATVTYTPFNPALEEEDFFDFTAVDECGLVGTGTVTINPVDTSPPDPGPQVVDATDVSVDTTTETAVQIPLAAGGPNPVSFSVESLPSGGSLADSGGNPITSVPATLTDNLVTYTPAAGTTSDSFDFGASDGQTSDSATVSIGVQELYELAADRQLVTAVETPIQFTLTASPGGAGDPGGQGPQTQSASVARIGRSPSRPVTMQAGPPVSIDAGVAWNVADSTGDGFGDESNADNPSWPATPGLVSAGVGGAGGPGSNGTSRIHIEFDVANLAGTAVEAATVELSTSQGVSDSLDTFFFIGDASGNGTLENSDFETGATELDGVVMPVSGAGSFSFDVTTEVQAALDAGFSHFVVQGRVDEQLGGSARGLQVRSACLTCAGADVPTLVVTPGGEPNLEVTDFQAPATLTVDEPIGDLLVATVTNTGDAAIAAGTLASIGFYTSVDAEITTGDRLLSGGRENLSQQAPNGLAPGESVVIDLFSGANVSSTFPDASPPDGEVYIGVLVDEFGDIAESDETDNDASVLTTVESAGVEIVWEINSLPLSTSGSLRTLSGVAVTVGQTFQTEPTLVFTPATGFSGTASFSWQATQAGVVDSAIYDIVVAVLGDCLADEVFCDDGRLGGGGGFTQSAELPPGSPGVSLEVEGPGTIAAAPLGVGHGRAPAACGGKCSARFLHGETVLLAARPSGAEVEFVGWKGDCSGGGVLALMTARDGARCVAVFRAESGSERGWNR